MVPFRGADADSGLYQDRKQEVEQLAPLTALRHAAQAGEFGLGNALRKRVHELACLRRQLSLVHGHRSRLRNKSGCRISMITCGVWTRQSLNYAILLLTAMNVLTSF